MQRTSVSILLGLVMLFNFIISCGKADIIEGNPREPGRWEVLTESPFTSIVPISVNVIFFDENNGIAEESVQIKKTIDGGKTWNVIHSFKRKAVQSLVFTDGNVGWVVGSEFGPDKKNEPFILNSKDRGISWQHVIIGKNDSEKINQKFARFYDICFSSAGNSWIVGDAGIVEALVDGQNLKVANLFLTPKALYSVSCNDEGDVWAAGEEGSVYHYQDGWDRKQIDKTYSFLKVKSIGNDIWLLGSRKSPKGDDLSGILLRSGDKGVSWEDRTPEDIRFFSDMYLEKGEGWLVGAGGNIYYSNDNGDSWKKFKSPTKNNLENIYFLNAGNIWIGGTNQTILKFKTN